MDTQNQLDPQIISLAKAIRQVESGGRMVPGASGEYGAYQFTEPTWNSYASKYGINTPLKESTIELQNEVAYKKIKEWKDAGYNPGQIASMWNAGEGRPDAYVQNWKGVNKYGVAYDTPAYAKKVAEHYQQFKQEVAPTGTLAATNDPMGGAMGYDATPQIAPDPQGMTQNPQSPHGIVNNLAQGNFKEAGIDALKGLGKGTMTVANKAGGVVEKSLNTMSSPFVGLAAMPVQAGVAGYNKLNNIWGGKDVADPYKDGLGTDMKGDSAIKVSPLTVKDKAKDAGRVAIHSGITALTGLAGSKISASRGGVLNSPTFKTILDKELGMNPATFAKLSQLEKIKVLGNNLAHISKVNQGSSMILEKAILELGKKSPGLIQKALGMMTGGKIGPLDVAGGLYVADKVKNLYKDFVNR